MYRPRRTASCPLETPAYTHAHTHTHTQSTYLLLGEEEVDVCGVIDINFVQVCARFSELA